MPRDFKTILCPTDFSDSSYHALDYALRFVQLSQGTLVVPHIVYDPVGSGFVPDMPPLPIDEIRQRAQESLEALQKTHLQNYPNCVFLVEVGDPYSEILAIAEQRKVDLIVTATHGRTGLQHLIMGSVAEKIIRH